MTEKKSLMEVISSYMENNTLAIPIFNSIAVRLQDVLAKSDYSIDEVNRLIVADPGLASQVLRVSNSSFYAGLNKVTTIQDAIVRLGAACVANIVMMATQKNIYRSDDAGLNGLMGDLWKHSLCCAIGSRWLATKVNYGAISQEAFLAGLLHDIGKMYLLKVLEEIMKEKNYETDISAALILEVIESMHSVHGARIMDQWNLPEAYVIVARDHETQEWDVKNPLLAIVRLVNQTCRKIGVHSSPDPSLVLFAAPEAQMLGAREITLAELEIVIEDALQITD
jgi:putative nucleotidyltransferase with HDIG domain